MNIYFLFQKTDLYSTFKESIYLSLLSIILKYLFYKDLLKLEGVQSNDDEMKPKKKVNEEDLSQYSKISLDGGHKGKHSSF